MTLRISVAGAGLIGKSHLQRIEASPRLEVASIVDPSPAAQDLATRYGVRLYADLDEMFAADRPDGVVLATPNQLHEANATTAIEHGVPALLEKPATDSVESGERLVRLVEERHAKLLVGHHRTYSGIMALAREVVQSGRIGDIVAVNGRALYYKPDDYFPAAPWRTQPGGGPVRINIIHEVHNLRILCGEIESVQAVTSNRRRGFAVEDTAAIIFTFASGVLATFLISDAAAAPWSWEQTVQEDPAFDAHPEQNCYELAGSLGSLGIPTMELFTYADQDSRSWWKPLGKQTLEIPRVDPLVAQLDHFADVITDDAQPLVSVRDGVQNVKIVEAIHRSAASGRPVHL